MSSAEKITDKTVRFEEKRINRAIPIPEIEKPYPKEINQTNFLNPNALISIAIANKIKKFI
jgi:hypothetical protein